ncbi:hypothetical protein C5167_009330 [Papaver somniferum]|uniref:Uncharacterized protein n=1 Tax=Papaver somniferum TaxID=3469 RepID=A0A4Y7K100_PAPSO|nr:hypothetical protein C5167_009330 [Papaver somniferum]
MACRSWLISPREEIGVFHHAPVVAIVSILVFAEQKNLSLVFPFPVFPFADVAFGTQTTIHKSIEDQIILVMLCLTNAGELCSLLTKDEET